MFSAQTAFWTVFIAFIANSILTLHNCKEIEKLKDQLNKEKKDGE
ncbi:hypothetical protein [Butyrivibrio sp. INlla21]|nr:hypothetical protein [Butyrivibrio sp. INlla21]SFU32197.1 hypothetical protein SAMN02910342_00066 [Butyrivibrio sp. INlla21]